MVGFLSCSSALTEVADCSEGKVTEWPERSLGCSSDSSVLLHAEGWGEVRLSRKVLVSGLDRWPHQSPQCLFTGVHCEPENSVWQLLVGTILNFCERPRLRGTEWGQVGCGLRAFILVALSGSSANVTLLPCFLVDGQSLLGEQVGWQDRRPQAGRRRRSQVLSSTPAGDLPTQPHPVPDNGHLWPCLPWPALPTCACLCLTSAQNSHPSHPNLGPILTSGSCLAFPLWPNPQ